MKKSNFTKDQIETLLIDGQIAVSTNLAFNSPDKITSDLDRINDFLKMAFELHLIDDYNDVLKLQKQVGAAAMDEYSKLTQGDKELQSYVVSYSKYDDDYQTAIVKTSKSPVEVSHYFKEVKKARLVFGVGFATADDIRPGQPIIEI